MSVAVHCDYNRSYQTTHGRDSIQYAGPKVCGFFFTAMVNYMQHIFIITNCPEIHKVVQLSHCALIKTLFTSHLTLPPQPAKPASKPEKQACA